MTAIRMPQLGLTMEEGTIQRWLKREGEAVAKGEPLFEVETDKVVMEVEAPASGTLARIIASDNQTVKVGAEVGLLSD
jgi:pyruvate/2-oxoglutarate dehydrogenase complex dihydrolipoamide acyltransferase (E2) component